MITRRFISLVALAAITVGAGATSVVSTPEDTTRTESVSKVSIAPADTIAARPDPRVTEHEWLFGGGWSNVLDTYLSPLEYTGSSFLVAHRTERPVRWGGGHVTFQTYIEGRGAYANSPTDDNDYWDADFTASMAWLRNWQLNEKWRVAVGGLGEFTTGFTYTTNGGNNPAQARVALNIGVTGVAEYKFRLLKQPWTVRTQLELPMLGLMFAPHYGQSYYEIFVLGHDDHNVCFTHPFNAPSLRWTTTLRWQWRSTTLSLGYMANVRQSDVNSLKHHAWNNLIVIGYARRLRLLP